MVFVCACMVFVFVCVCACGTVVVSLAQGLWSQSSSPTQAILTLSAHAREGYSNHPVCLSVCLSRSDFGDY